MSNEFESTPLWRRTLGGENCPTSEVQATELLRSAFLQFREVITPMANDIANSMPMFTDHSINHIDSLWDTASIITGDEFPLNPAEAFVLGGAFLLHDLGMGLVAFPDGLKSITEDPLFMSFVAASEQRYRAVSGEQELTDAMRGAARDEATVTILRLRHARQAERLISQEFRTSSGEAFRLLENAELRTAFGPIIGRIAHSHWFNVEDLPSAFPNIKGSHSKHPPSWEIDPLKIACILRLADAIHIDSRRAPTYLHAFRKPEGVSHDHWYFQERLTRPRLSGDRLLYTSTQPFEPDEARAWWLAYETIQMIDRELHQVDALCADTDRTRFLALAVSGADSPKRLAQYIETRGWDPVDARVRVTQVGSVISALGGKELYGDEPSIALRELLSNAADATRARVLQFGGSDNDIVVRLWSDVEDNYWLSVTDHGIGMDQGRLVSALTDFGKSGWMSDQMLTEYPKLVGKDYRSTGKFGIGFFSVFMLGDHVEVKSLKALDASDRTSKLVFDNGLSSRPVLQRVEPSEYLLSGGTVVTVRLKHDPLDNKGLLQTQAIRVSRAEMLKKRIQVGCALSDTSIGLADSEDGEYDVIVRADQWKTLPAGALFDVLYAQNLSDPLDAPMYREYRKLFEANLSPIYDQRGDIVARAILTAGIEDVFSSDIWWWPSPRANIYVGGMEASKIWSSMGAFVGEPLKADRRSAFPVATIDALRSWVEEQVGLLSANAYATSASRYEAAQLARSVGVEVPFLPLGFIRGGELTPAGIEAWLQSLNEVLLIASYEFLTFHHDDGRLMVIDRTRGREVELPDSAVMIDMYNLWFFPEEIVPPPKDDRFKNYGELVEGVFNPLAWWHRQDKYSSASAILNAASSVWMADAVELAAGTEHLALRNEEDSRVSVRCTDGTFISVEMFRLKRP